MRSRRPPLSLCQEQPSSVANKTGVRRRHFYARTGKVRCGRERCGNSCPNFDHYHHHHHHALPLVFEENKSLECVALDIGLPFVQQLYPTLRSYPFLPFVACAATPHHSLSRSMWALGLEGVGGLSKCCKPIHGCLSESGSELEPSKNGLYGTRTSNFKLQASPFSVSSFTNNSARDMDDTRLAVDVEAACKLS